MANTKTDIKTKPRRKKQNRFTVDIPSMLVQGEHVVSEASIHTGIYWKSIGVLVFSIIIALILAVELGILFAIVSIIMFAHATLKKEILLLVLTNKRIFVRYGLLQVDIVDIRFDKIESMELERMITGYLMGYATLAIAGTGNRYITIPYVSNAREIRRSFNRLTLADDDLQDDPEGKQS